MPKGVLQTHSAVAQTMVVRERLNQYVAVTFRITATVREIGYTTNRL